MRTRVLALSFVLSLVAAAGGALLLRGAADASSAREPSRGDLRSTLEGLPLSFIENRGQADPRASYYLQGAETSVWFTPSGLRMGLAEPKGRGWNLALDFVGARATPVGLDRTPARVSYFKGDPQQWHTGLPTYSRVAYRDLWPGIDLRWSGTGSRLKYSFLVHPGTDPSVVRLQWRGATGVGVGEDGRLEVSTPVRSFNDGAPVSFQRAGGARTEIHTSYDLDGSTYGFDLGTYDRGRPLVIDPAILVYAGYIGGSGNELGHGVAVDGAGAAYLTGQTTSTEATFPEAVGPDLTFNSGFDAFVAKVVPSGASLSYAGYLGGSGTDIGRGVAVDSAGAAYLTGQTTSTEATFPVAVGPDLTHNGSNDAFVAKVAPSGASLSYAGFIGGSGTDDGLGMAVDGAGAAYLTGRTGSTEATFPVAVGPDLTYNGAVDDAFVAKVVPSGASLSYAGYIGGSGSDIGLGMAVDSAGAAYLTGETTSSEATFPVAVGPDLTYNDTFEFDAFVAKVAPSGASLSYAGYLGGAGRDIGFGVAVDGTGAAYLTGSTGSTEATFPEAVGPDLTHNGGGDDAFVAKVAPSGASLAYAGYIGGAGFDVGFGVAVDGTGAAYLTGSTTSSEATFPETVGPDLTYNGGGDAFVAKVVPTGASLSYAGYLGGSGTDNGFGVAVDGTGAAYLTGSTTSTEATFPVAVGPDLTYNGGTNDAFVARVSIAHTLTVTKAGTGSGTVTSSPPGINCGGDCSESYNEGTVVTLTATPSAGSTFAGWSGGSCSGTGTCMVPMDADKTVTAAFNQAPTAQPKSVTLKAKPKKVEEGRKTKLTAVVAPCAGHEGDLVEFYRGAKKIATKASDGTCTAKLRVKMKKTTRFKAVSPQQDADHLAGTSNRVKVKVL